MIRPLRDKVMFVFIDAVERGMFYDKTKSGIILGANNDATLKEPRWARVIEIGPDVKSPEIFVGAEVLVDALRWTDGFKINGQKIWFTVEKDISLVRWPHMFNETFFESIGDVGQSTFTKYDYTNP